MVDDDGNKVKVIITTRVRKLAKARLSRSAIERRQWPKFGDAVKEDAGSRLTMVSTEEILIERPRAPGLDPSALLDPLPPLLICCVLPKDLSSYLMFPTIGFVPSAKEMI